MPQSRWRGGLIVVEGRRGKGRAIIREPEGTAGIRRRRRRLLTHSPGLRLHKGPHIVEAQQKQARRHAKHHGHGHNEGERARHHALVVEQSPRAHASRRAQAGGAEADADHLHRGHTGAEGNPAQPKPQAQHGEAEEH